jgi:hypothetical protein
MAQLGQTAVIFNEQNQPTSITNLNVAGTSYNVTIQYGGTFNDQFGSLATPAPVPTFWENEAGARNAVQSLAETLNAVTNRPPVTTQLVVPISRGADSGFFFNFVEAVEASFEVGATNYTYSPGLPEPEAILFEPDVVLGANVGWPKFAQVSEPSSLALLVLGGGLFCGRRLRR